MMNNQNVSFGNFLSVTLCLIVVLGFVSCQSTSEIKNLRRKAVILQQELENTKRSEEKLNEDLKKEIEKNKNLEKKIILRAIFLTLDNFDNFGEIIKEKKPIELCNEKVKESKEEIPVKASAYIMGSTTATGKKAIPGMIAASNDLIKKWGFGSKILLYRKDKDNNIKKIGTYQLEDRMHHRWIKTVDIRMSSYQQCMNWGRQKVYAMKIG